MNKIHESRVKFPTFFDDLHFELYEDKYGDEEYYYLVHKVTNSSDFVKLNSPLHLCITINKKIFSRDLKSQNDLIGVSYGIELTHNLN